MDSTQFVSTFTYGVYLILIAVVIVIGVIVIYSFLKGKPMKF